MLSYLPASESQRFSMRHESRSPQGLTAPRLTESPQDPKAWAKSIRRSTLTAGAKCVGHGHAKRETPSRSGQPETHGRLDVEAPGEPRCEPDSSAEDTGLSQPCIVDSRGASERACNGHADRQRVVERQAIAY